MIMIFKRNVGRCILIFHLAYLALPCFALKRTKNSLFDFNIGKRHTGVDARA